ncbi:MAG: hypothetical protein ACTSQY_02080 [Candidatus Odinarchaeia archaeon]
MGTKKYGEKVPIELEIIRTPKGDVPTANSFRSLVDAINLLDGEIEETRGQFMTQIDDLRKDIKSIKKLIAEETVTLEALNETLKETGAKMTQITNEGLKLDDSKVIEIFNKSILPAIEELKENNKKMEQSFVKALNSMAKIVELKLDIKKKQK